MRVEPRLRRLEEQRRNPYARDPRLAPLLTELHAGRSLRDVADDELELLIAWSKHEYGASTIDVTAMSDAELNAVIDGIEFLERYRMTG